jgi:hypothetical protein
MEEIIEESGFEVTAASLESLNHPKFLSLINWEAHKEIYISIITTILWFIMGLSYARFYEKFEIFYCFYFALGGISCSGFPSPVCKGAVFGISRAFI